MTTEKRWVDDGAPPAVARLLESTVIDEPSSEQLLALRGRVAPLMKTPPGGPAGGAPAAAGIAGKIGAAVVLLALGGILGVVLGRNPPPPPPLSPSPRGAEGTPAAPVLASPSAVEPAPVVVEPPAPAPRKVVAMKPAAPEPPPVPSSPAPATADEELELLQAAMAAASADQMLALVEQHAARFPDSSLAQEREVLAVQALARLGRSADAKTRGASFRERWPTSTHLLRIEALIANP